ncbi:uncharacterized protein LOC110819141 isoform X3 [Carica papaya]|nr:uncharacterized protein LOC110819141 isoform X2 [Carica papaya]XP_021904104.1 uncharacterized protein LOC110819141 isoform X3 [Carica papaya]
MLIQSFYNSTSLYPVRLDNITRSTACLTRASKNCSLVATSIFAAAVVIASAAAAAAPPDDETLSNIPQTLSGECAEVKDCRKPRIQRPKSRKAESCTVKCLTTCIRGGDGSPGEGPLNLRRPLVVFKQGFRSRQY